MLTVFSRDAERLRGAELTKIRTLGWFWAMLEGTPQLILAGVTWGGVLAVAHGSMTLGQLVAFLTLYLRLIWPIISLGWLLALTEEAASAAAARIFEVLDTEPTILDPDRPVPAEAGTSLSCSRTSASATPTHRRDVLRGVDLDIEPGETMALVGARRLAARRR